MGVPEGVRVPRIPWHARVYQPNPPVTDDSVSQDQYGGLRRVFQKTFMLLRAMARGNRVVQGRLFDRLDMLLSKEGAAAELAECLTEVGTCTGQVSVSLR